MTGSVELARRGLASARENLAAVTWRYVASFVAALPVALAFGALVDGYFASSLEAERFAAGLDVQLWAELLFDRADALALFGPMLLGGLVFWVAISAFLTGGVLSTVNADVPLRTNELFAAGGRGFGRLMRLFPLGVGFSLLVVGVVGALVMLGQKKLTEDWVSEQGVALTRWLGFFVIGLVLSWANGAYDLMKVEAVTRGEHRARYAFVRGVAAAARSPLRVLGVYLPFVVLAVVVTLLFSLVDVRIARTNAGLVVLAFVLQQIAAFVRSFLSVALAGAEVRLMARP